MMMMIAFITFKSSLVPLLEGLRRDMWSNCRILEKICRMCRIIITELHGYINQLRITLTPALPIHNERNYQELKRKRENERDNTHTTDARLRESERQRGRTLKKECYDRVSQQTLDPIHCPLKLNWMSQASAQGAEVHLSSYVSEYVV